MDLQQRIEELYARAPRKFGKEYFRAFDELKAGLNEGSIRAAEPDSASPTGWKVNAWVKKGILLGFRIGRVVEMNPVAGRPRGAPSPGRRAKSAPRGVGLPVRREDTLSPQETPKDREQRRGPPGA